MYKFIVAFLLLVASASAFAPAPLDNMSASTTALKEGETKLAELAEAPRGRQAAL